MAHLACAIWVHCGCGVSRCHLRHERDWRLCIGVIVGLAVPASLPPKTTLLLKTGFCGGFTTFSTFALEASGLFERGNWFVGGGYMLLSLVLGVLACFAGQIVAGGLCPRV